MRARGVANPERFRVVVVVVVVIARAAFAFR